MNEPIGAFENGIVDFVGYNKSLGNWVDIKDENGLIHRYGHANKILVKKGDVINKGDIIANAGSTGISTGPHLHYSIKEGSRNINPVTYHSKNNFSEKIMIDANGNKALVKINADGKPVEVIKEL